MRGSGDTWTRMQTGVMSETLRSIWGSSESNIYAVGSHGVIVHYDGTAWRRMASGVAPPLNVLSVWGASPTEVYAGVSDGRILRLVGGAWTAVAGPTSRAVYALYGTSGTDTWGVGAGGQVMHYDGTTWRSMRALHPRNYPGKQDGERAHLAGADHTVQEIRERDER